MEKCKYCELSNFETKEEVVNHVKTFHPKMFKKTPNKKQKAPYYPKWDF